MCRATAIETRPTREDVFLMAVPMFHAAGMGMRLHQAVFLGGAGVIHRGSFDPEAIFRLIERHRLTMAVRVPMVVVFRSVEVSPGWRRSARRAPRAGRGGGSRPGYVPVRQDRVALSGSCARGTSLEVRCGSLNGAVGGRLGWMDP